LSTDQLRGRGRGRGTGLGAELMFTSDAKKQPKEKWKRDGTIWNNKTDWGTYIQEVAWWEKKKGRWHGREGSMSTPPEKRAENQTCLEEGSGGTGSWEVRKQKRKMGKRERTRSSRKATQGKKKKKP